MKSNQTLETTLMYVPLLVAMYMYIQGLHCRVEHRENT